jgi:Mg-chelatase subunit ChlD
LKTNHDYIAFVLDRSGSMSNCWGDTVGAGREFLQSQANAEGRTAELTFVLFDDEYLCSVQSEPLTSQLASSVDFQRPRGNTALLDAIGRTVSTVGSELAARSDDTRPEHVILVVLTDGHENNSKEYTLPKIKEMVEHQRVTYGWQFIFLGADLSAIGTGVSMGFSADSSASYSTAKMSATMDSMSSAVLRGRSTGVSAYTDEERSAIV